MRIPNCTLYSFSFDHAQDDILIRLYPNSTNELPPAIAFCDDYLICLYNGSDVWEMHIFRTVSVYDNHRIEEMLLARKELLQNRENMAYLSEDTQERMASARIITHQNFVILAITDQNDLVEHIIRQ